jgi:CDGSH-type Zn-finger protein
MPQRTDVEIVPYRDGPYLIRGPVVVRDQEGRTVPVTRRPVALCRCGKSQMRPFCDGTHQTIGFEAPSEAERPFPTAVPPCPSLPIEADAPRPRASTVEAEASLRSAAGLIHEALDELGRAAGEGHDDTDLRRAMDQLRATARELERRL